MTYQAPDYEVVQLQVETLFASYGCAEKNYWEWTYTVPCAGTPEYTYEQQTFTGLGLVSECFENNLA